MKEKKHYEAPATKLVRVELESDICAGSEGQDTQKEERHININQQDNGGSVDFSSSDKNTWD